MTQSIAKTGIAIGITVMFLSGCAVVRVADAAVDTAVSIGTTGVRGVAAGGRLATRGLRAGEEETNACRNPARVASCTR